MPQIDCRAGRQDPEAQLPLAQAAIYIACAPKSNAAASAIWKATSDVNSGATIPVPKHLKDSHYKAAKELGISERALRYKIKVKGSSGTDNKMNEND